MPPTKRRRHHSPSIAPVQQQPTAAVIAVTTLVDIFAWMPFCFERLAIALANDQCTETWLKYYTCAPI